MKSFPYIANVLVGLIITFGLYTKLLFIYLFDFYVLGLFSYLGLRLNKSESLNQSAQDLKSYLSFWYSIYIFITLDS